MLAIIYGVAVLLGLLAGAVFAGLAMLPAIALAMITRLTVPISFAATQFAIWLIWHRTVSPINSGLETGEVDGPVGIGAVGLLFGTHAFSIAGAACTLGLSIKLWIEASKREASKRQKSK